MISWVNVKGTWKPSVKSFGKANGVWELLGKGDATLEPFNKALKIVGVDKVESLSVLLTSSEMCTALAGNAEAYDIMKENYSSDMVSAIDDNFNDGLNLLNYKCGLKCAVYKDGTNMIGIDLVRGAYWGTDKNGNNMLVESGDTYKRIYTTTTSDRGANGWLQTSVPIDLTTYSSISTSIKYSGKSTYSVLAFGYGDTLGAGNTQDSWNTYSGTDKDITFTNTKETSTTATLDCSSVDGEKTIGYFCSTATESAGSIYVYDLWVLP